MHQNVTTLSQIILHSMNLNTLETRKKEMRDSDNKQIVPKISVIFILN